METIARAYKNSSTPDVTASPAPARHPRVIASAVIEKKPDYAEGWNRRATVYFLAGDLRRSIADCDEVLKRNPGHFGALSGLGQIHLQLDDLPQALRWYRRALEVNPNMLGVEMNIRMIEEQLKAGSPPARGQRT